MGQFVVTSYKEERLHYQLFIGQFVIASYKEEKASFPTLYRAVCDNII